MISFSMDNFLLWLMACVTLFCFLGLVVLALTAFLNKIEERCLSDRIALHRESCVLEAEYAILGNDLRQLQIGAETLCGRSGFWYSEIRPLTIPYPHYEVRIDFHFVHSDFCDGAKDVVRCKALLDPSCVIFPEIEAILRELPHYMAEAIYAGHAAEDINVMHGDYLPCSLRVVVSVASLPDLRAPECREFRVFLGNAPPYAGKDDFINEKIRRIGFALKVMFYEFHALDVSRGKYEEEMNDVE